MAKTYGKLDSDNGSSRTTKRSGREYVEAIAQSQNVRATVTTWASDRVDIELRHMVGQDITGDYIARLTLYPAGEVEDYDRPVLLVDDDRGLDAIVKDGEVMP